MNNSQDFNPFVSIALTTFNGKELLREQLDSILQQTYQNYEVVMSDDGSDEDTLNIIKSYCEKDKRFRWSRSPLERGFIKNSQNAIDLCKGEIIILCDQDDVWYPNKIQLHVDAYRDPSVMWAFNRFVITDGQGKETGHIEELIPNYYRHKSMIENTWGTCIGAAQTSYRANLLKSVMPIPDFVPAHDSWIQLAIYPAKPHIIPTITNTYRQHRNNMFGMPGTVHTEEEIKAREKLAISENLVYLKKLSYTKYLPLWKRVVFFAVYNAKIVRAFWRRVTASSKPY